DGKFDPRGDIVSTKAAFGMVVLLILLGVAGSIFYVNKQKSDALEAAQAASAALSLAADAIEYDAFTHDCGEKVSGTLAEYEKRRIDAEIARKAVALRFGENSEEDLRLRQGQTNSKILLDNKRIKCLKRQI